MRGATLASGAKAMLLNVKGGSTEPLPHTQCTSAHALSAPMQSVLGEDGFSLVPWVHHVLQVRPRAILC